MKTCYWVGRDEHDLNGPYLLYANALSAAKRDGLDIFVQLGDAASGDPNDAEIVLRRRAKDYPEVRSLPGD